MKNGTGYSGLGEMRAMKYDEGYKLHDLPSLEISYSFGNVFRVDTKKGFSTLQNRKGRLQYNALIKISK
jgi:hypothetical protein